MEKTIKQKINQFKAIQKQAIALNHKNIQMNCEKVNGGVNRTGYRTRQASYHVPRITQDLFSYRWTWLTEKMSFKIVTVNMKKVHKEMLRG